MEIPEILFIRHNFDNAEEMHKYCIQNKYIAIHFNNEGFVNFEDYSEVAKNDKGFRKAFETFKTVGKKGGLIMAQYDKTQFYIGEIILGTQIELFNFGKYRRSNNEDNYYKLLKLNKVLGPFNYADYPLLSALRPPFVTIMPLSEYSHNLILHLWKNIPLLCELNNLHPKMLEQICDEWLRNKYSKNFQIRYELLKTGKTLPVIDIYAETKSGKRLLAQVTHTKDSKKALKKAKKLKEYITDSPHSINTILLYFGPKEHEEVIKKLGLDFVPIEDVFDTFYNDPTYKEMLEKMIGLKS